MSDTGLGTNQLKTQGWELIINGTRGGETQDTENTGLTTSLIVLWARFTNSLHKCKPSFGLKTIVRIF